MGEIYMYGGKREEETKHVPLLLYSKIKTIDFCYKYATPSGVEDKNN
jgi:hypothetical protein